MKQSKQITGIDVAERAGVSKSAVSRAFTGGSVSPEARKRILQAARELRYRPNQSARSLKTNRSNLVGLAVSHIDNLFYPAVIQTFSERFAEKGIRVALFVTHGDKGLDPVVDELLAFSLDGVILASSSLAAGVARECMEASLPAIMFNNVDPEGRVPGVSADNWAGGTAIAEHFIERGFRNMAVITGVGESSTSSERTQSFCQAVAKSGLPAPTIANGQYSPERAASAMQDLIAMAERPDAVFCVNDHMAIAAIEACLAAGLRPGRDIAIAGFDNTDLANWPSFSLTSYSQPIDEMVDACVQALLEAVAGKEIGQSITRIPGKLIVRASSGRCA